MRMKPALAVPTLALALSGCNEVTRPSDLIGGTWRLVALRSAAGTAVPSDPGRYTVSFDDDRVSVRADCNSCGGGYRLAGDTLTVSTLACTRVACPADSLEQPFLAVLMDTSTVDVDGDRLTLSSDEGRLDLER
jgi:heat shock protein HslJ